MLTSSRELVSRTLSRSFASTSGGFDFAQCAPNPGERGYCPESLLLPKKGTSSAPRALKAKNGGTSQRRNIPEAQVEDFNPWVRPESSRPPQFWKKKRRRKRRRGC